MYSASSKPVDSGLGFDFSDIADLAKSVATTGLNIYQNQVQLQQTKSMTQQAQQYGYAMPTAGQYGQQYGILPMSQVMQPRPTFGAPTQYIAPPSGGVSTQTTVMMGAGVLGALVLLKVLTK